MDQNMNFNKTMDRDMSFKKAMEQEINYNKYMDPGKKIDYNSILEETLKVCPREEWKPMPPRNRHDMPHPIRFVKFTLNTETPRCFNTDECLAIVRDLQKKHMDAGMDDIQYNFLVGDDGVVYEGRGWFFKPSITLPPAPGAPGSAVEFYYKKFPDMHNQYIDIAFIGDHRTERYKQEWLEGKLCDAQWDLIEFGLQRKYFDRDMDYVPFEDIDYSKVKIPGEEKMRKKEEKKKEKKEKKTGNVETDVKEKKQFVFDEDDYMKSVGSTLKNENEDDDGSNIFTMEDYVNYVSKHSSTANGENERVMNRNSTTNSRTEVRANEVPD